MHSGSDITGKSKHEGNSNKWSNFILCTLLNIVETISFIMENKMYDTKTPIQKSHSAKNR